MDHQAFHAILFQENIVLYIVKQFVTLIIGVICNNDITLSDGLNVNRMFLDVFFKLIFFGSCYNPRIALMFFG